MFHISLSFPNFYMRKELDFKLINKYPINYVLLYLLNIFYDPDASI